MGILPENKIHKCPYNCGLGFLVYNSLINHVSNDHLENLGANETHNANYLEDNPYKCFKCDERFSDRRKAMQHSAKHSEKSHVDIDFKIRVQIMRELPIFGWNFDLS